MLIERKPLRAEVGAEILGRILDGRLPSGARINESHLARDLGISRTPLREAMLCLTATGVLDADMGRGFAVPHYTRREVVELLETLSVVLAAALRQGRPCAFKDQMEARNMLTRAHLDRGQPAAFCERFYRFMLLLAGLCRNTMLRCECERLAQLLLRYLHAALARGWDPVTALAGLQEGLEVLHREESMEAGKRFERVFLQMSADLAARFPEALDPPA